MSSDTLPCKEWEIICGSRNIFIKNAFSCGALRKERPVIHERLSPRLLIGLFHIVMVIRLAQAVVLTPTLRLARLLSGI